MRAAALPAKPRNCRWLIFELLVCLHVSNRLTAFPADPTTLPLALRAVTGSDWEHSPKVSTTTSKLRAKQRGVVAQQGQLKAVGQSRGRPSPRRRGPPFQDRHNRWHDGGWHPIHAQPASASAHLRGGKLRHSRSGGRCAGPLPPPPLPPPPLHAVSLLLAAGAAPLLFLVASAASLPLPLLLLLLLRATRR